MSRADRDHGSVPARPSDLVHADPGPPPRGPHRPPPDRPAGPGRRVSPRLVWRAIRRHWWQAALIWAAGSAGLVALADRKVRPTFDASSTIEVVPGARGGPPGEGDAGGDFETFKETQVQRVANPDAIARALAAHPELLRLPRLAAAKDPEAEVRRSVAVAMVPKTHLIRVSMSSGDADEAARVVNAVVEAFLKGTLDTTGEEAGRRSRRLREVMEERALAVRGKREAVAALVARLGTVDVRQARERNSATIEAYGVLTGQHLQADLGLVEARARLDQLRAAPAGAAADADVVAAFYAIPQVAEARAQLDKARDGLAQAERVARAPNDPARQAPRKKADDLQRQLDDLWARMRPGLAESARAGPGRAGEVRAAEARVDGLETRLAQLGERLERLNARTKAAGTDELTLEFARQDLARAEAVLDTVTRGIDRVEIEAGGPVARFRRESRARASALPDADHRLKAMAAAPLGMLLGVVGLMVLVELHAGRVADPDDLPARARLDVLGVIPPLPRSIPAAGPGPGPGREEARSRRDLDRFVQSLDHLRVALCSGRDAWGRARRSILITSACGGEGKTTLAAQLAERCVNAGLLTLLVDADIRNPTLSRMFDRPASRGLVDVLRGEATAEEAIVVVGGAGGFHFLPAGTPRVDPSRLLHGDRLARLLGSARESFDLVIVDSPPVLPVPDALTIGRWVDAAVLAVRHDCSRYPLVDRANRRLAYVGVPVIGAVVVGVRGPESSYYGGDYPSHGPVDGEALEA